MNQIAINQRTADMSTGIAIRSISMWLEGLPMGTEFKPKDLVRVAPVLGSVTIASLLQLLINTKILLQKYKVVLPSGDLYPTTYDDPRDIPEMIVVSNSSITTASLDITPVFTKVV